MLSRIFLYFARFLTLAILLTIGTSQAETVQKQTIRLATTTSTDNSGLLADLLPAFTDATGYPVHVIAVGTGKALRMGRDGDVDLVLVHARAAEDRFVAQGHGVKRYGVMYNDFVLIGPAEDPAGIAAARDAVAALKAIARHKASFISRGDDSGTHKKELGLWKESAIKPEGDWYREVGQGMGKVIQIASEMEAYTLTDRGTWLAYQEKSPLRIRFQGDPLLFNPYGIIAVSPERYPDINHRGANALIKWMISPQGQERIGNFRIGDNRLFTPSADAGEFASFNRDH
ncbi:MAG: solute-binding protein [gamma proteobacterium symbiont of Ctena orbiculata]|nr:substrate-binding domain-containing protein [Candidatus Thiodiazotropha taylori]MBT3060102.1 substrate-binding domain-containing protein [Candidatus Thiodiazotropha sp. (ex Lucina pensylvanica)]MBV2094881.1 substrate-binding domain-containing protein [Candidatus Thiodiazotropha sp. (ex Codakia orbicularis)]PUB78627.1 MAG: tungsten ABC transporter substrate-binding protein [gamma proteobacterium symbiont of Ctena orbiculata]MBT3063679.1 substrate-binding domain-containing protein [Candidatus 